MSMTLEALANLPHLQSRIVRGALAATKIVEWAHACELRDPWRWLGPGDLVMTTGIGIPTRPVDQEEYVTKCVQSGIVGIAIGERMHAPKSLDALLRAADERDFCVIFTAHDVPFVAMARAVASAKQSEERARIGRIERLYETVLSAQQKGHAGSGLLDEVGREIDCHIDVVAVSDGRPLLSAGIGAVQPRPRRAQPTNSRVTMEWPIPSFPDARLCLSTEPAANLPDVDLVRHVSMITALELARRAITMEVDRRQGAYLLAHLADGHLIPGDPAQLLVERGFVGGVYVLAVMSLSQSSVELHHILGDHAIPNALLARNDHILALLPDDDDALSLVSNATCTIGVSNPFEDPYLLQSACIEANLAYTTAMEHGLSSCRFGKRPIGLLPQSAEDAQHIVGRVLGPLLALDTERSSEYVRSLRVFLEENRSWLRASQRLHVHKQTLVYRMTRVAELTGRRLDNTDDVATLWLALKAASALNDARTRC